jgi:hypothetical protein
LTSDIVTQAPVTIGHSMVIQVMAGSPQPDPSRQKTWSSRRYVRL